jgi:hypothetical protein
MTPGPTITDEQYLSPALNNSTLDQSAASGGLLSAGAAPITALAEFTAIKNIENTTTATARDSEKSFESFAEGLGPIDTPIIIGRLCLSFCGTDPEESETPQIATPFVLAGVRAQPSKLPSMCATSKNSC